MDVRNEVWHEKLYEGMPKFSSSLGNKWKLYLQHINLEAVMSSINHGCWKKQQEKKEKNIG